MTTAMAENLLVVTSADGTPIGCWRQGSGPALVLVHGTGEDHRRWRLITARLADRFTVYAVDRRGRGASGDAEPYTLAQEACDLAAVVDQAVADQADRADGSAGPRVAMLAHSYGAICAIEAVRRTSGLARMVLYEPPIPVPGSPDYAPAAAELRALAANGQYDQALGSFLTNIAGVPQEYVFAFRTASGSSGRPKLAATLAREIEATQCYQPAPAGPSSPVLPVLLLVGEASPEPRQRAAAAAAAMFPGGRVQALPGQGHDAIDANPRVFIDAVLGFLLEGAS